LEVEGEGEAVASGEEDIDVGFVVPVPVDEGEIGGGVVVGDGVDMAAVVLLCKVLLSNSLINPCKKF
jgi:hypothetical protein